MFPRNYSLPKGVIPSTIAHLYSRVSSAAQLDGQGMRRQQEGTDQWVADHGLTILNSYEDRGVSAYRGKNRKDGQLAVILKKIESGVIKPGEHLIIESFDRLSRQPPMDAMNLLSQILKKGIIVHSVLDRAVYTEQSVNEKSAELLVIMLGMMRSNEESRLKGHRIGMA
ncbi:recombinase family protein [Methylobacterium iners]|uniref:Resolvase/invertase-type recombinase catalytic domain-containing protein n=1 Tax=Methylobacterium iners TaxID=418707 RepID=A0ABQ4RVY8_9HYPH|nr:recombinase family protein [Methylobacterium iners]GJD94781.1 hypothetical protein OCOJLMKI_1985 [Methylobacterium iners]